MSPDAQIQHDALIQHVNVNVDDLATAVVFYRDVLGLALDPTPDQGFESQFFRINARQQIHMNVLADARPFRGHFCLELPDFMGVFARAKAAGAIDLAPWGRVRRLPGGKMQLFVRDPHGNLIEIASQSGAVIDQALFQDELVEPEPGVYRMAPGASVGGRDSLSARRMILLLESLHPEAEALLASAGPLLRATDPNEPPSELSLVRAILTRGRGRIPEALLARCPALVVIARAGAGLDNLDTAAAARRGIPVIYAPGANTNTVAEHTLALMLDLARGLTRGARAVAAGRWEERAHYRGDELGGLTLGIVGFGNIGQRVATLAAAFGMHVLVAAHPARPDFPCPYPRLPLRELLAVADIVTLHVPLTSATRNLLGAAELACMKPGALLINTARGALIDMPALRAALASFALGGFAADVLDVEPPRPDDPLLAADNVLLTPHVASLTAATYRALCLSTAENVVRVLRGEAPDPRNVFRGA